MALEAFAQLCRLTGATTNCTMYSSVAYDYAKVWMEESLVEEPAPHYKMSCALEQESNTTPCAHMCTHART